MLRDNLNERSVQRCLAYRSTTNSGDPCATQSIDDMLESSLVRLRLPAESALRRSSSPQIKQTGPRRRRCFVTWRRCVRGEVFRLHAPRRSRGHEQSGSRFAVVVQSDHLPLSTWLMAPTSTSARAASFRPEVEIGGRATRVLVEQTAAVDPGRLGKSVGYLSLDEMRRLDAALRIVLNR